jgi:hypothetical protein
LVLPTGRVVSVLAFPVLLCLVDKVDSALEVAEYRPDLDLGLGVELIPVLFLNREYQ